MKYLIVLSLVVLPAWANGPHDPPRPYDPPKPPVAQRQAQDQAQDQVQRQSQEQANSQSVTFEDREQAPSVIPPTVYPTASCERGLSGGGSGGGWGAAFGFSYSKKECELVVLAQNYAAIGLTQAACEVLNTTKAAEKAFGATKPSCRVETKTVLVTQDTSQFVTRQELAERDARIIEAATRK